MTERILEHYFLAVRIGILLLLEIYIALSGLIFTGASYEVLLLLALLVGMVAGAELTSQFRRYLCLGGGCSDMVNIVLSAGKYLPDVGDFFML